MFNRIYNLVKSLARGRNIWLLGITTALLLVVYNFIKLPDFIAGQLGYSGSQPMFAIDLQFNYSPAWVYTVLGDYGEKGRAAYGYLSGLFDFIFPLIYSLFLATALSAILSRLWPGKESGWPKLSLLGLLAGIMDWLENIGIISLIINYPRQLPWLVNITNTFTMAKYGLVLLSLLVIMAGGIILLLRRRNPTAVTIKPAKRVK
jgi:hypothetical protein